jgi:hypothetical protein
VSVIILQGVTATLQASPTPLPLKVVSASATLDETRAPYGELQLVIHTPASVDAEKINPRTGLRVTVAVTQTWVNPIKPNQTRSFDLYLHDRTSDWTTGETTLVLRTDEAKLIDDGLVSNAVNTAAYAVDGSLRSIVNLILTGIGAALEAGPDDANFTRTANATNLVRNPRVGTNTTDWGQSGTAATQTRNTVGGPTAHSPSFWRIGLAASSAASAMIVTVDKAGVQGLVAGQTYVMSAWMRCSAAVSFGFDGLTYTAANVQVQDLPEVPIAVAANTWKRMVLEFVAGAAVTQMTVRMFASIGTIPSGGTFDVTGIRVSVKTTAHDDDDFDGASTDSNYAYAWLGTAHASQSTRTRLDTRPLTLLDRRPGQASWDFLAPLVQQSGLRLFCDEQRKWRLVNSNSYLVAGQINIATAGNLESGTDTIDLAGDWATGIVVHYQWIDSTGATKEAWDSAGTATKVETIEIAREYPGPGAATVILARYQGRGRVLDPTVIADLNATPGQYTQATVPNAPIQSGVASLVSWSVPDGTMRVSTRGLIDTPATAWIFLAAGQRWIDSAVGQSWIAETV